MLTVIFSKDIGEDLGNRRSKGKVTRKIILILVYIELIASRWHQVLFKPQKYGPSTHFDVNVYS